MTGTIRLLLSASALAISFPMATAPATAQNTEAEAPSRTYSAEEFYTSTTFGTVSGQGHACSPDGSAVLVTSDESGVRNAYWQPLDGGERMQLTSSQSDAYNAVSAFPGDGRILFSANSGGNEINHLFVREEDGTIRDLTPGEETRAGFSGWTADGSGFYVETNERDASSSDLYLFDAGDYSREPIFQNPGGYWLGSVSPNGRWLVLTKEETNTNSDLYLVDLQGDGEPVLVTPGDAEVTHGAEGFTPDSAKLVYTTNEFGEFRQAWTYDIATGERDLLAEDEWDVSFVDYSPSGRYRVTAFNRDGATDVTVFDTVEGEEIDVGMEVANMGGFRFSPDESMAMFAANTDTSPTDIYHLDLASEQVSRLTSALNPAIVESDLVTSTVARFASYDGVEIPGILYRPKGAGAGNPAPAVVYVHGGPGGQSRQGYSPVIQHLVNHGYAVYAINNRGSSGYGTTFFHMDDLKHGDADLRDVVASKDFLQGMDWIADDRIAVMGGSYGGYMTAAALAFHPEVFDAGINIFGVTNWLRTLESIPAWWGPQRDALFDELGDPATDSERLRAISPLLHADRIVKPMLVVQGANDPRVLQVESDELVEAARANGAPVEYVLFPDEGHGFTRRDNRITASKAYLAFLNEHVGTE
ncbi:alpha/beta hydrolase family protein [Aurantiacibacter odishensis]|uniref:S9 family peptidase n=1 Tax=Aurantiacibacter odishensis TaxID=1155476 RepID=UPI000E734BEB|nr:S9 family peptidase [Aurantiacibacter odishensis]